MVKRLAVKIRRSHRLRLPDAIIAATALYLKVPLLSADRDFEEVNELSLLLYETGTV
jgi:predicted nucleic acid-binding protein